MVSGGIYSTMEVGNYPLCELTQRLVENYKLETIKPDNHSTSKLEIIHSVNQF